MSSHQDTSRTHSDSVLGKRPAEDSLEGQTAPKQVIRAATVDESNPPFSLLHAPITIKRLRCVVAIHDNNNTCITVGSIGPAAIDLSIDIRIDAGRLGFPSLVVGVNIANPLTGKPFSKEQPQGRQQQSDAKQSHFDTAYYTWYPAYPGANGKYMIEAFEFQPFPTWLTNTEPFMRTPPAIRAIGEMNGSDKIMVVTCQLRSATFSCSKETPIWQCLPATVSSQFEALRGDVKASFFFRAPVETRDWHLPMFSRRVAEHIGMLAQYQDAMGRYTLNQIKTALPVEKVGGGMYTSADGKIKQLPTHHQFIDVSHFKTMTALGPIRKAQHPTSDQDYPALKRQLKAVKDFCDSRKMAIINFRNLLMLGGKPEPSSVNLCGSSHATSAVFRSLLGAIKSDLDDVSQLEFLEKLTDIQDNVLALTGPPGSGKHHVLHLAIWLILLLGHKILVCGVDNTYMDDLILQVLKSKPDWAQDKNLLRLAYTDEIGYAETLDLEIDGLFLTLQHSGSQYLQHLDFEPSVVIVCEAGRASIPSVCIPITAFDSWETLLLVGDHRQLAPWERKGVKSEVADHSKQTALQVLEKFQTNTCTLRYQWRMTPEIALFPAKHFYGGRFQYVQSDPSHETIMKVRATASKYYQINDTNGSEYFVLDVPNTQSRTDEDEESPVNYGNAAAIEELIAHFNEEGIPAEDIVVLSFYASQVRLLSVRLKASDDGTQGCREVQTIDSFCGRQAKIVIVDFVIAGSAAKYVPATSARGASNPAKLGILAEFVRDPHRINLALTRARYGLVVVGQMARLVSHGFGGGDLGNTLYWLVYDARKRKLIYSADQIIDDHPQAIYSREVEEIMTDQTDQDTAVTLRNYHTFVKEQLSRAAPNPKHYT
ncbi:MAG: hypothetical protein Q9169_005531 [Polycauliona sp. 2 TL-2023]